MSLAVVCPSRGRPERCVRMVDSALRTSKADVLVYIDSDDRVPELQGAIGSGRTKLMVGPPVGRGLAVNRIIDIYRDYRMYLVVSDDVQFTRDGWDDDILAAMNSFGDDIGLVHLAGSNPSQSTGEPWVNWACVSRKWIDALGWFNYPDLRWFCQDTVLQILAEALGRVLRIDRVALHHDCVDHPDMLDHLCQDSNRFLWFCAKDFGNCLFKLKAAMRKSD